MPILGKGLKVHDEAGSLRKAWKGSLTRMVERRVVLKGSSIESKQNWVDSPKGEPAYEG